MNEDILKGKWQEVKGIAKEKWGKFTDNDLSEIDGKGEKLFGLLQKKYGHIRDKSRLEYIDSVELAEIVSSIRGIMTKMTKKKDIMAIAFIARYGRPLLANKHESQITVEEVSHGNHTDHDNSHRTHRSPANLAPQ
ncbi:MAG: CsbD family protein [Proteobacteria bacterium]|nr:CsbD family protein [Pseudomonadota bacterium]